MSAWYVVPGFEFWSADGIQRLEKRAFSTLSAAQEYASMGHAHWEFEQKTNTELGRTWGFLPRDRNLDPVIYEVMAGSSDDALIAYGAWLSKKWATVRADNRSRRRLSGFLSKIRARCARKQ